MRIRSRLAIRAALFVVLVAIIASCASTGGSGTRTRRNSSVMDTTELRSHDFATVLDAISALRADWLLPRGGPSGQRNPELGVWLEGSTRSVGVAYLRNLRPIDVKQVRRLSTTESLHTYSWPWGGLVITPR
jgi:hypothetical protein